MAGGGLVVVLQIDLLNQLTTRVVAPLIPAAAMGRVLRTLNPAVTLGAEPYLVVPRLAATLTLSEMGETGLCLNLRGAVAAFGL